MADWVGRELFFRLEKRIENFTVAETARSIWVFDMRVALLSCCLLMLGCGEIPMDAEGTVEAIGDTGELHVTIVSGTRDASPALDLVTRLADGLEAETRVIRKPAAIALRDLEEGMTDIVVGEFGRTSPESKEASLSDAIGQPEPRDGKVPVLRFARKKGENRLITRTDLMVMR